MRPLPLLVALLAVATMTAHAGPKGTKPLIKRFDRLDRNDDDTIDAGEFAQLLPAKWTRNNALDETQEAMFAWFDEDGSEGIDLAEWLEALTSADFGRPYFSGAVIDELDANGDGKLKWKEFSRVIPKYVSSETARGWFNSISSGSSVGVAAFSVTNDSGTVTVVGPSDTVSGDALLEAGQKDLVTTTGGDCWAPAP
jgi:Ca2+-binding EF-hand superfamily protein